MLYVYVYVRTYVCMYLYVCICMYVYVYAHIQFFGVHIHFMYMYVYVHACMYVYICAYSIFLVCLFWLLQGRLLDLEWDTSNGRFAACFDFHSRKKDRNQERGESEVQAHPKLVL